MAVTLQSIVTSWTTNLAKIKTADGYHTTVVTVTSFEPRPESSSHLPAIDVRDMSDEIADVSLGDDQGGSDAAAEKHVAHFELYLTMNSTATALRSFIMDVRKAVRDNMTGTYDISYLGHDVVIEQEEVRVVGAVMRFDVTYWTALLGEE
jgi:hypothetical protein